MTTVRLLVVSESTSTSSTVGCHCELRSALSESLRANLMESDHETGNSTRSVASATRMPSDATDDDEVREREFL